MCYKWLTSLVRGLKSVKNKFIVSVHITGDINRK